MKGDFNFLFLTAEVENQLYFLVIDICCHKESVKECFLIIFGVDVTGLEHLQTGDDILPGQLGFSFCLGNGEQASDIPLFGFQLGQPGLCGGGEDASLNSSEKIGNRSLHIVQLRLQGFNAQVRDTFSLIFHDCICQGQNGFICQHGIPESGCDKAFDGVAADIALGAAVMVCPAAFTGVVIVGSVCMTGARDADHGFLTVATEQLAGEQIQTAFPAAPLGRAASGILPGILLQVTDGLDFIKKCLGDDGRNAAGNDDIPVVIQTGITLIAEDPVEAGFVPLLALLRGDATGIQIPDDVSQGFMLPDAVENLPDDLCFRFLDGIAAILATDIAQRQGTIDHALVGIVIHAALHLSAQLLRVVFGQTFQKGFHEDAGGIIGDILHGGKNFDACVLQLPFVHGTVVPIPGEAVEGIDNDIFPVADFCILDHPLEAGALVTGAGEGSVFIYMDDTQAVAVSELFTGPDLLLDGNIPLGMAGIPGIDHGILIFILGNVSHNYLAFPGQLCYSE